MCVYRDWGGDGDVCNFFSLLRSWISPEKKSGFAETATAILSNIFYLFFLDLALIHLY